MIYNIKEIFLTLQGEGFNTGRKAVFCRFSGCNLWNGLEKSRKKGTVLILVKKPNGGSRFFTLNF